MDNNITRLIVIRHGNTFAPGVTPTRVGAKTDLDLVESHRGSSVGRYLRDNNLIPDQVFSGPLKRQTQTVEQALEAMDLDLAINIEDSFVEIDYGPCEDKTEDDVYSILGEGDPKKGEQIIELWNSKAIVPKGWVVDLDQIVKDWIAFGDRVKSEFTGKTTLLCSSNGVIRLAPHLTGDFDKFSENNDLKVATGSISIFELDNCGNWICSGWNLKPYKLYPKG